MKMWMQEPRLRRAMERIVDSLSPDQYRFRRLSPVVFICGGLDSSPRNTLRDYFRRRLPNLQVFYAERVWELIAADPGLGALKMESDLAALSDLIIIIVESPGTFAELGAFSHVPELRRKLLPIVDRRYRGVNSFINTGPVRWIDKESEFRPTIWARHSQILEAANEIEQRIARIPKPKPEKVSDLARSRKHLLFFVCDLVGVVAPTTIEGLEYLLATIVPSIPVRELEIKMLVGLAEAMGLIKKDRIDLDGESTTFFSPVSPDTLSHPYHRIKWVSLAELRSEFLSGLLALPQAVNVLRLVSKGL
jgi:hypothetical protein